MRVLRKFVATAAVLTTAGAIALQGGASVASASASSATARDGGRVGAVHATPDPSQTPKQVRDHSAKVVGALSGAQHLRINFGIKPRDVAGAEAFNQAVQNRNSPLFHHYLTAKQWNARFAPTKASEQAVVDWARKNGLTVTHRYPNRMLVDVDATASALESALHVKLNRYSLGGKAMYSNDRDPVLPASIASTVTSVGGLNDVATLTTSFPSSGLAKTKGYSAGPMVRSGPSVHANGSKTKLAAATAATAAKHGGAGPAITGGSYDPTDIYSSQMYDENALYAQSPCCNPNHVANSSPPESSIAIASVGSQAGTDIQGFQARYSYLALNVNEVFIGGTPSCCDGEGTMDIEWSTALANSFGSFADTAHIWAYDGVNAQITTFNSIFNQILTDGHAKIVSSSWGCAEITCYTDSDMNTNHNIFNAMIGQGYTLVNASDDKGAYADCTATQRVQYPASDSDFLAISATNLELNSSGSYVSEQAWPANSAGCAGNGGGGGGGCSVKFAAPSYQSGISSFCGSASKAVPDVSLNGDWFNSPQNLYFNGGFQGNGGTSIAAPEFAGFFAAENSYLISMGTVCGSTCAPLGQAGSELYLAAQSHAAQGKNAFYDTTSGCTSNDIGGGFCAIVGYDRATGWGTVNMLQLAWAINYWSVAEASPPTVTISGPSTSGYINTGSMSWSIVDNGSPAVGVSGYTAQWDADPGDVTSHATPGSGDSFYSGPATTGASGSTGLLQGCHTLFVRAWDKIGESAASSYGPVCYDTGTPSITQVPKVSLEKNSSVASGDVPVKVSWDGTDSVSGVKSYRLQQSLDGGAFANVGGVVTTNSKTLNLPAGHAYRFRVRATDFANNTSAYVKGKTVHVDLFEENNGAVAYSSGWSRIAQAGASGGFVKEATVAGKKATFTFTGTQVGLVMSTASTDGQATVVLDGGAPATVDSHAAGAFGKVRYVKATSAGSHTFVVTVSGTAGHPNIDLDAFAVIS